MRLRRRLIVVTPETSPQLVVLIFHHKQLTQ